MDAIKAYLLAELPRINQRLATRIDGLHPLVAPIAGHTMLAGGKRLRPMLTILTARALGLAEGIDLYDLACAMEFLHAATLLHDDILDDADLRRGQPAAHLVYGRTETILAGDALLALANKLVADYGQPRLVSILSEAVMRTAVGEIAEIASLRAPGLSRQEYMDIITGKTAYLIQASCQSGAVAAGAAPELEEAAAAFGVHLGVAFQLVDDALDYASPAEITGKPAGGDLREGKLTWPLILHLESLPESEGTALQARIKAQSLSPDESEALVETIRATGRAEATRQLAAQEADAARQALEVFPPSHERTCLFQSIDYTLTRLK